MYRGIGPESGCREGKEEEECRVGECQHCYARHSSHLLRQGSHNYICVFS